MIRMSFVSAALAGAIALAPAAALAQQGYTTAELVNHFVSQIDLGPSRGICIGTPAECAPPEAATAPVPLDMRVTFELNSADLTPEARQSLAVFAAMMQHDRLVRYRFSVEGHTDARGGDEYNQALSEARAAAVRAELATLGVPTDRLDIVGFGKRQPRVADAFDPENRRVELRMLR